MDPNNPSAQGRARGRSRGVARGTPLASGVGPGGSSPPTVHGISPPHRHGPPGRYGTESQMQLLSLEEAAMADNGQELTRFGNGNGNGNGNGGNGNGNGRGGNGRDPDEEVAGREGEWEAARAQALSRTVDRYDLVTTRTAGTPPNAGVLGAVTACYVNYFQVFTSVQWEMYQYRVDFSPPVDDTRLRRNLMQKFRGLDGFGQFIFDSHSLWKTSPITADLHQVTTDNPPGGTTHITMRLVGVLPPNDPAFIQFFNNVTRTCLRMLRLCPMGRNYFDPRGEVNIAHYGLKLWPGFITTMRHHEGGLLYCVELTTKVIRTENVFQMMRQVRTDATRQGLDYREAVKAQICGGIVLTMYNNRTYKVDDISWEENPNSTFTRADNSTVTFAEYYQRYDSHKITAMNQPLLVSHPKARDIRAGRNQDVKLVPELCQLTGLTDKMRADFTMMRELSRHLQLEPEDKLLKTVDFVRRLLSDPAVLQEMQGWGMELRLAPMVVNGRVLPREKIVLRGARNPNGDRFFQEIDDKADFTNAFRNSGGWMLKTVDLTNWVVLIPQRDSNGLNNLLSMLQRVSGSIGLNISRPVEVMSLHDTGAQSYANALVQVRNKHRDVQMVFVILPNQRLDVYSAVKKKCYIEHGVASQCFLTKHFKNERQLMSICTKVVIQMNAKLGGECWGIQIPLKGLMIVGFDVHHGGAGQTGGSIGAMVCTTSLECLQYFSTASVSRSREEVSSNMATDIEKCLLAYRKGNNGALPDRIMFYRDGVGDGQLAQVYRTELQSILSCLDDCYKNKANREPPMFSMIICTKRINTRIFEKTGNKKCVNPTPRMVIDTTITLPQRWEFFLISQYTRQGTVSPTNYNVIYDMNGLDSDKVQRLTYKLCHLYYNWSGGVAVPAVVQYAHKLAFLTGTALGAPVNHSALYNRLYYL